MEVQSVKMDAHCFAISALSFVAATTSSNSPISKGVLIFWPQSAVFEMNYWEEALFGTIIREQLAQEIWVLPRLPIWEKN